MRAISLFSGCGGLDFGAEAAGCSIVLANDIDSDSCKSLVKYLPNAEVDGRDVKLIRAFPKAELVIGGYPCQSFSMGGNRDPEKDGRTHLFREFARCVDVVQPLYFVAENVSGLQKLRDGIFLKEQIDVFQGLGEHGYEVSHKVLDAKDFGIPQSRKRLFIVGIRKDQRRTFRFPPPTHGKTGRRDTKGLLAFASHGEAIKHLPLWPTGEFYERPHDPEGHFSWYYMSRNRKAAWDGPSFTVVANWRHVTLHPASPKMTLTWSNLADGWKQRWDFAEAYEHTQKDSSRQVLKEARRLSWRECAAIQTFPDGFEPIGDVESKFNQIGNAVPPNLARVIFGQLLSEKGLVDLSSVLPSNAEQGEFALG